MQTIHQLSESLIAKIAAGEVVERPAYALKELLDNAIDAQATEIIIEIEDAGLAKIVVKDNGIGMSKEDVREACKPHTTSKINSVTDLHAIKSLGFRGEALWSIASISDLTIKSRHCSQDVGTIAEFKSGDLESFAPIGIPVGTTIEVRNLFESIPARKKFMRSLQTEYRHIFDMVVSSALSFPHIGYVLIHNNKQVLNFAPEQTTEQRMSELFGTGITNLLIPIAHSYEYLQISGCITKPQASLSTALKQFIFVNNRRVFDKILASTIKTAYGTLLEPKVQPAFVIFLKVPPERIDVNIHPRKEQVAFSETSVITKALTDAVTTALAKGDLTYQDMRWKKAQYATSPKNPESLREGQTSSYAGKLLKETTNVWTVNDTAVIDATAVTQIHNTFLLRQTSQGIELVDQHAAHERILYEQFLEQFQKEKSKKDMYDLPQPVILTLGCKGALLIENNITELENVGFKLNLIQENTYEIIQAPLIYKDKNITRLITEMLSEIEEGIPDESIDTQSHKMLAYLACRSAIKAGDKLTEEQALNLLTKLANTHTQYTCPHGRPVKIELSLKELYKLFHRT